LPCDVLERVECMVVQRDAGHGNSVHVYSC
jgi:hypothetical protein